MNNFKIVPYLPIDGILPFRDSFIMSVWDIMSFESLANRVFFDDSIVNREQFLCKVKTHSNLFFFCMDCEALAAVFWLDAFCHNRANIHFCVMREYWGSQAKAIGSMGLRTVGEMQKADGKPLLHMVVGVTEAANSLAIRYAKSIGLSKCGHIPGFLFNARLGKNVDAAVLSYTFGG